EREGATLFMVLFAAYAALLSRRSGQEDFAIGTHVAGRARVETERLIGAFINTLVLRVDLSGAPTFEEIVARVRKTALGAYAHQDLPFAKVVQALAVERNLSRGPLYQTIFRRQN